MFSALGFFPRIDFQIPTTKSTAYQTQLSLFSPNNSIFTVHNCPPTLLAVIPRISPQQKKHISVAYPLCHVSQSPPSNPIQRPQITIPLPPYAYFPLYKPPFSSLIPSSSSSPFQNPSSRSVFRSRILIPNPPASTKSMAFRVASAIFLVALIVGSAIAQSPSASPKVAPSQPPTTAAPSPKSAPPTPSASSPSTPPSASPPTSTPSASSPTPSAASSPPAPATPTPSGSPAANTPTSSVSPPAEAPASGAVAISAGFTAVALLAAGLMI